MKNKLSKLFSYLPIMYGVMLNVAIGLKIKVLKAFGYISTKEFMLMVNRGEYEMPQDVILQIRKLPREQVNYRDKNGVIRMMKVAPNQKMYKEVIQMASIYRKLYLLNSHQDRERLIYETHLQYNKELVQSIC
jgi:hypothetical protein